MHVLENVRQAPVVRTVGSLTTDDLGHHIALNRPEDGLRWPGFPIAGTLTKAHHETGYGDGGPYTWIGLSGPDGWRYFCRHQATDPVVVR